MIGSLDSALNAITGTKGLLWHYFNILEHYELVCLDQGDPEYLALFM